jgi:uncharacterized protein
VTASGATPGPSSVPARAVWKELGVAAAGFIAAVAVTAGFGSLSRLWAGAPAALGAVLDLVVLSLPLVAATAVAVTVSRRHARDALGLRSLRVADVVLGLAFGLLARAVVELLAPTAGSLAGPFGAPADLPVVIVIVAGAVLVSPVVEELFFRGIVLRALQSGCRGPLGRATATGVAVAVSTAAFVSLHLVTAGAAVPIGLLAGTVVVGVGCGILSAVTGRLYAPLIAHVVFNLLGVVLLAL